ncbi:hypothetical protein AUK22_09850 [bacterium CG2_30_54_10]|nr:MAG: hypothetical protein AUK22_09850 [bacterium CG2_30_54_10]
MASQELLARIASFRREIERLEALAKRTDLEPPEGFVVAAVVNTDGDADDDTACRTCNFVVVPAEFGTEVTAKFCGSTLTVYRKDCCGEGYEMPSYCAFGTHFPEEAVKNFR